MSAGMEGLGTVRRGTYPTSRSPARVSAGSRPEGDYIPHMAEPTEAGRSFDDEALPHLDALYRVALRLTADPTQAEDLVQDTMLKAYRSWRQYRPGSNAKGWLL